jgi:hypothetical protein
MSEIEDCRQFERIMAQSTSFKQAQSGRRIDRASDFTPQKEVDMMNHCLIYHALAH